MTWVWLFLFVLTGALMLMGCDDDAGDSDALPPVYVTFYSHNEEGGYWESLVDDSVAYGEYRADLVAKITLLRQHGAVLNWESDHSVLRAMAAHEQGALLDETQGKNVLAWMVEDMGMVVDPHGHLTTYNYADLAHLIQELGVSPSGVVGGFAIYACGATEGVFDQLDWRAALEIDEEGLIHGRAYPEATWRPVVLAQPAMRGHSLDEFSSGVWRPEDVGEGGDFLIHDPDSEFITVGQGYPHDRNNIGDVNSGGATIWYEDAAYVRELSEKIQSGTVPANGFYTASIHLRDLPELPGMGPTIDGLRATLEALTELVADGRVIYMDYEEVVEVWEDTHHGMPSRLGIEEFSIYDDLMAEVNELCWGEQESCLVVGCPEGEVCVPEAERCVPDCRIPGNTCPEQMPVCDEQTGFCQAGTAVDVTSVEFLVTNPTSGVDWWAKAFYPSDAGSAKRYPTMVKVPGGSGAGSASEDSPDLDRRPDLQAAEGYVVVIFDADGRGNTAGTEDYCGHIHQDGLAVLIETVASWDVVDVDRLALFTSSYGITMGSGVLARYPELPVLFLLDWEGPANRMDTGHCDADNTGHITHDCDDDLWWSEREAAVFMTQVAVPYLRMQEVQDHAQPDNLHAILMVNNATHTSHGGGGLSPWTCVNGPEVNPINTTYSETEPPVYQQDLSAGPGVWGPMFTLHAP
ncbi:MAG: hypothetical protein JRF33_00485 [Deltaproteobacteria bacterium]|nr:hypothetical protein [Deltaproteobacteria bacterium]